MIKAIIFDCFGVLVTEGWLPFKATHFGKDPDLNRQATELSHRANAGLISHDEFVEAIAGLAGLSGREVSEAIDVNVPNEPLLEYIKQLKKHYAIGMLSNASGNWLAQLFTKEQVELFDAVGLSYELGAVKPDERAYEEIIDQLGVEPSECVFVDDQERHCTGAREAGMQAILYQDFDQFKEELEAILAK